MERGSNLVVGDSLKIITLTSFPKCLNKKEDEEEEEEEGEEEEEES